MKKIIVLFLSILLYCKTLYSSDIIVWAEDATSITLDVYSVQKIFTKKINKWPNGKNINVFIKPINSIEHKQFVMKVLQMTPYYYQELLDRQTYAGKSSPVIEVPNDKLMIMKVENTPGSIGYIDYELYAENKRVIIITPEQLLN